MCMLLLGHDSSSEPPVGIFLHEYYLMESSQQFCEEGRHDILLQIRNLRLTEAAFCKGYILERGSFSLRILCVLTLKSAFCPHHVAPKADLSTAGNACKAQ